MFLVRVALSKVVALENCVSFTITVQMAMYFTFLILVERVFTR